MSKVGLSKQTEMLIDGLSLLDISQDSILPIVVALIGKPEKEEQMLCWVVDLVKHKVPVTDVEVMEKALLLSGNRGPLERLRSICGK